MKKIFLIVIALSSLAFYSCNTKGNYPELTWGSLEGGALVGKYMVTYEGETLVASQGTKFIDLPDNLNRMWIGLEYYIDESEAALPAAQQKEVKVYQCYQRYGFNQRPAERDEFEHDEPIRFLPSKDEYGNLLPIFTRQNYLFMGIGHHYYLKNKKSDESFARFDFAIEYDPTLVQAASRTDPDTINLHLKFFANRAADEKLTDDQSGYSTLSLDLEDLRDYFGIGNDKDFTYVLKLNYFSYDYESGATATNEDKKSYKSVLVKWKPNDQFEDIEWEK